MSRSENYFYAELFQEQTASQRLAHKAESFEKNTTVLPEKMCNPTNRSVDDFETIEALQEALMDVKISNDDDVVKSDSKSAKKANKLATEKLPENSDWVLSNYDPETTKKPTLQGELDRLQVLRSYMILDAGPEEVVEGFTAMAARTFNVPIALVSLVDLGRQWLLSNCGLGDAKETPRRLAFCAHTILSKDNDVMIVNDATTDFRFKDNELVTGPPHIRFYAGAPLISPEGYSLGSFCIIDTKPRPDGMSNEEKATLEDLAAQTVKRLVTRRRGMEKRGLKPRRRRTSPAMMQSAAVAY